MAHEVDGSYVRFRPFADVGSVRLWDGGATGIFRLSKGALS